MGFSGSGFVIVLRRRKPSFVLCLAITEKSLMIWFEEVWKEEAPPVASKANKPCWRMAREYCADSGGDGLFKPHWLRYPDARSPFRRQEKTSSQVFPWPFPAEQGAAPLTNPTQIETMPFLVWYTGCRTDTAGRFCAAPSRGVFRKWGTLYTFYRLRFPTRFNSIKAQAVFF